MLKHQYKILSMLLCLALIALSGLQPMAQDAPPDQTYELILYVELSTLTIVIPQSETANNMPISNSLCLVVNEGSVDAQELSQYCLVDLFDLSFLPEIPLPTCFHLYDTSVSGAERDRPADCDNASINIRPRRPVFWVANQGTGDVRRVAIHDNDEFVGTCSNYAPAGYVCTLTYTIVTPVLAPTTTITPTQTPTNDSGSEIVPTATSTATITPTSSPTPPTVVTVPPNPELVATPSEPVIEQFSGYEMVYVVGGGCVRLNDENEEHCQTDSFWIDRYEYSQEPNTGLPLTNIDPDEATTLCEARETETRLPTIEEWLYAASGPSSRDYTWDGTGEMGIATMGANSNLSPVHVNRLTPADQPGMFQDISWVGAYHMQGNVSEWTASIEGEQHILAGNNYGQASIHPLRNWVLHPSTPTFRNGFRCMKPDS